MNNRLVKLLIDSKLGGQNIGIDLYNHTWFNDIHPTITTRSIDSNNYFIKEDMNEDITTKVACTLDEGKWARMHEQSRRVFDTDAIAPTQHCCGGGNLETKIAEPQPINATDDGCATTLTTAHHYSGNIVNPKRGQTEMGVQEGFRIRKLTPRECFRLMGCDEPTIDKLLSAGISNSQLYKLAGNSIVVDVLYHIFRRMLVDTDVQKGEQIVIF